MPVQPKQPRNEQTSLFASTDTYRVPVTHKRCRKCHTVKTRGEFYWDSVRKDHYSYCKLCHRAQCERWRENNMEKVALGAMRRYYTDPAKFRERSRAYAKANRDENVKKGRARANQRWRTCIDGLGGVCTCCGETCLSMLEIDHIHGNGNKHRRLAGGSVGVYAQIIKDGFPKDRFQVLCSNCNQSKRRNGGTCEHLGKP